MNLLVVAPHFPPSHVGGVEAYTKMLADRMHAEGHRVSVIAVHALAGGAEDGCDAVVDTSFGYDVHRLTLTLAAGQAFPLRWAHAPGRRAVDAVLARTAADVLHVHSGYLLGAPALAASAARGVPAVLTLHDYWFSCPRITLQQPGGGVCTGPEGEAKCAACLVADQRRVQSIGRAVGAGRAASWLGQGNRALVADRQRGLSALLQGVAAVLAPTRFVAAQNAVAGVPAARVQLSRYGFTAMPRLPRTDGGGILRLAFIGQLAPHKGVHLAIAAVRSLPGAPLRLDIHGPLDPHPAYVARLRELAGGDARIVFHGPYTRDRLPVVLQHADAVVVPSVWHEVAALVIQEAQAAALPVIGTRLGGTPELVTHDVDGLLFDPVVDGALAAQLQRLLDEPGLRDRLAANAPPPRTSDDEIAALLGLYAQVARRP